ncbi:hypothetical protein [Streptomyces sp. NRRL F-5123]|uniref:hypothetical protein n=1 Tax=Streptomyces sp. NRRL F-5123 TaxID=1463856 RepID=UPI0004E1030D|nr:hypothetical protein [Streptomyces sp. NRRL F-5123]
MGYGDDDPVVLRQRATALRDHARQARTLAKSLSGYLDGAVSKAQPRPGSALTGGAMWTGPYADRCTTTLAQRQKALHAMAASLTADAARWESAASDLEDRAKSKSAAGTPASGPK